VIVGRSYTGPRFRNRTADDYCQPVPEAGPGRSTLSRSVSQQVGTPREATEFGEVVVFSVLWDSIDAALAEMGSLEGKIVIDTSDQFRTLPTRCTSRDTAWAMSEENVEIVRKGLDAFNAYIRGEMSSETLAEHLDPQLEWHWRDERTIPDVPQHLRSAAELIEALEKFRGAWIDLAVAPLEFVEAPGDRVVTLIRQSGRGKGSGVSIVFHYFFVCTIREGTVRRLELFRHRADALEAAGLRD
jgi:ketosteroid isomerase-like protein